MALPSSRSAAVLLLFLGTFVVGAEPLGRMQGPKEKLCEACTEAVTQLGVILSDPDIINQSVVLLEGTVCSQLQGDLQEQCDLAVEEYVPLVLAEAQNILSVDSICIKATHLCPAPPPLSPPQSPEECLACRLVLKLLKKHLDNPKTQAKIQVYLENRCSHISNSTKATQCREAVDKYLPDIFANIDVILNERILCKKAGLCPVLAQESFASA